MLATRLWMGSLLIVLAVGMLFLDNRFFVPVFPFLWLFQTFVTLIGCVELILLLGPGRRPQVLTSIAGVLVMSAVNWFANQEVYYGLRIDLMFSPWSGVFGCFVALVLAVFIWEMALYQEDGRSLERIGLTLLILVYLGLLPCFFAQTRWLFASPARGSVALALAIFVPKGCDIGAYFTGRLLGRHRLTPVLSPKKTWEGAVGGLVLAVLVAIALDRWLTLGILKHRLDVEIAFGLSVGAAGMLGDLAESLIKRDCRRKDASGVVPGFGGILDVLDAVIFAAPISYLWMVWLV
jgi:phosphatidate cytidylyltransferase